MKIIEFYWNSSDKWFKQFHEVKLVIFEQNEEP